MPQKKRTCLVLVTGLLIPGLLSNPATAQIESDHVCFVVDDFGSVFNLDSLCGSPGSSSPTRSNNSTVSFSNARAGTVGFEAQLSSRATSPEIISELPYEIIYNSGARNEVVVQGSAYVHTPEGILLPGTTVTIGDTFTSDDRERFGRYFIQALELRISYGNEVVRLDLARDEILNYQRDRYGTLLPRPCTFPWQIDSVGRRCGGRAAIARPGGV